MLPLLALFAKRIAGDDCLLELARRRFHRAGLGLELQPGSPEHLEQLLHFRPAPQTPVTVHLTHDLNLFEASGRERILDYAGRFARRVNGLVIHDQPELAAQPDAYVRAAKELNSRLQAIPGGPMLYVEYASGLEPARFAQFFMAAWNLTCLGACIDVGHVGIWQARQTFFQLHPGEDVCALKSQPARLPSLMPDVDAAVSSALPTVLRLIEAIGACGKPVHFHLHDGHPLSTFSPFGVADHLSFLGEVPLPFTYRGRRSVPLLFGPAGLAQIAAKALQAIGPDRVSFTLEIHPVFERLPLGEEAPLFSHWTDKTNAEQMNHWLSVLCDNQQLLLAAMRR